MLVGMTWDLVIPIQYNTPIEGGDVTGCTVNTGQAARIAGATERQLDYWARTGVVVPRTPAKGPGSERAWSFLDVLRLRILAELRDAGIPLQRIRKALERLERWDMRNPLASGQLLAVGGQLFWIESEATLINLQQGQRAMAPVILLDLREIARNTETEMLRACAA